MAGVKRREQMPPGIAICLARAIVDLEYFRF
jgi:hypothetical protein